MNVGSNEQSKIFSSKILKIKNYSPCQMKKTAKFLITDYFMIAKDPRNYTVF